LEELRAGVEPSGFSDLSEIKVAICYLLSFCKLPLSKEQIFDILDLNGLVNYFYFSQALEELLKNKQVKKIDGYYSPEESGLEAAQTLKGTLAGNIRELLAKSATSYGKRIDFEKWHCIKTKREKIGYTITCEIADDDLELMKISLFVPEKDMLNMIKKRFEEEPEEIYKRIVNILTDEDFE
jgi:hypothetical protein